jgi:hypothetical protein
MISTSPRELTTNGALKMTSDLAASAPQRVPMESRTDCRVGLVLSKVTPGGPGYAIGSLTRRPQAEDAEQD